jgi:D,D-heptose 1,7-bisphosphate phosphatase
MKRPAVFFDRDNTLIVCDGYLGDPAGVRLVDGAAAAVARARSLGFAIVTVSNQAAVAKGLFTEHDVEAVNVRLDELLRQENAEAIVDRHEYCPFHPEGTIDAYRRDSDLRKPKPGMLLRAAEALDLDLSKSWLIGDAGRDIEAGQAAGCRTIWFKPPDLAASTHAGNAPSRPADFEVTTLGDALERIAMVLSTEPAEEQAKAPAGDSVASDTSDGSPRASARNYQDGSAPPPQSPADNASTDFKRLEKLAEQILFEVRRRNEHPRQDFSVPKLLAGVTQVIAIAALIATYFVHDHEWIVPTLLIALTLQTLTISLLLMGRDHH